MPQVSESLQQRDCFGRFRGLEDITSGHEDVGSGIGEEFAGLGVDAAVDFDHCFRTRAVDESAEFADFVDRMPDERLASETGID